MAAKLSKMKHFRRSLLFVLAALYLLFTGSGCESTASTPQEGDAQSSTAQESIASASQAGAEDSKQTSSSEPQSKMEGIFYPPYGIKNEWGYYAVAVGSTAEYERANGWYYINEELTLPLFEISFTLPAPEEKLSTCSLKYINRSYTVPFWKRTNALSYGLNQFCPTLSFVYPLERPVKEKDGKWRKELDTFIDIHVRKKGSAVGESFCDLTSYIGEKSTSNIALLTETVVSYHDVADFYEKNFAKAEAGTDENYVKFTRLPDQKIGTVTAYHYSFERNLDAAPPAAGAVQYHINEEYGEHYLFETDQYIYVFAYSGQLPLKGYEQFYEERDGKVQKLFRSIVEGIDFKTDQAKELELPIWANNAWIKEHISGEPEKVLTQLREAKEIKGELPDCVKELLESPE